MDDSSDAVANFPPEQRAIRDSCFHPAGTFIEFKQAEIDQSVCNRFEQQVAKYPGRIAVRTTRHTLTYDELNRASNRIARAILDRSAAVQQPIAVLFDHGAPFVIASLGVLKAGNVQATAGCRLSSSTRLTISRSARTAAGAGIPTRRRCTHS